MTDTQMLRDAIKESGVTLTYISEKMGLTREGLYNKLNGTSEFKASEIVKLSALLHLSAETREQIFFARMVI